MELAAVNVCSQKSSCKAAVNDKSAGKKCQKSIFADYLRNRFDIQNQKKDFCADDQPKKCVDERVDCVLNFYAEVFGQKNKDRTRKQNPRENAE